MTAGEEFEGVDEEDERADIEKPKGEEREAEGHAELEEGGAKESGNSVKKIEGREVEVNDAGKEKKAEGDGENSGEKVSATA